MISLIIYSILVVLAAIMLHELGHVWAFRRLGRDAQIVWGKKGFEINANYQGLNPLEAYTIYADGVFLGALPFIFAAVLINGFVALYIIPYLAMCHSDIKNMIRCQKNQQRLI